MSGRIGGPKLLVVAAGSVALSSLFYWVASLIPPPDEIDGIREIASFPPTDEGPEEEGVPVTTGGRCPAGFECVTIDAPVDHFGSDPGTVPVTFAILRSTGRSEGAFITVVGGPGASGIETAAYMTPYLEPLRERYDVVFFDMRGIEAWRSIDCPTALQANNDGYALLPTDPAERWQALDRLNRSFAEDCVLEVEDPVLLEHLRTREVAEDIEDFRRTLGYEQVILYGQSYGTQVARQYARTHPDQVRRLILDGVVDETTDVLEAVENDILGFEASLDIIFDHCDRDDWCSGDMAAPAAEVYDRLIEEVAGTPAIVRVPVDGVATEKTVLTAEDVGYLAFSSLYEPSTRMVFLRALAAYGSRADLLPMVRLFSTGYGSGIDPIVNTAVACTDGSYASSSVDDLYADITESREAADSENRWHFESVLGCAHWPHIELNRSPKERFPAVGIPTLILASDTDVATPYQGALDALEALEDGRMITVRNGSHVVFGRDIVCVDEATVAFALDGTEPATYECTVEAFAPYLSLLPSDWTLYTAEDMIALAEAEIYGFPELLGWPGVDDLTVACSDGGSATFSEDYTSTYFDLEACALGEGLVLAGNGSFDWVEGSSSLDVTLGSTGCSYAYHYDWASGETELEESC